MNPNKMDIYLYFKNFWWFFHHLSSYDEYKNREFFTKINKISDKFIDMTKQYINLNVNSKLELKSMTA